MTTTTSQAFRWWRQDGSLEKALQANPAFKETWDHLTEFHAQAVAFFYEAEARFPKSPRIGVVGEWALGRPFCSLTSKEYRVVLSTVSGSNWLEEHPRRWFAGLLTISPVRGRLQQNPDPKMWVTLPTDYVGKPLAVFLRASERALRRDLQAFASEIDLRTSTAEILRWVRAHQTAAKLPPHPRTNVRDRGREPWEWDWLDLLDGGKPSTTSAYHQRSRAVAALLAWRKKIGREWLDTLAWAHRSLPLH